MEKQNNIRVTVCPSCGYKAEGADDPLITAHDGRGECPKCGIILAKVVKQNENAEAPGPVKPAGTEPAFQDQAPAPPSSPPAQQAIDTPQAGEPLKATVPTAEAPKTQPVLPPLPEPETDFSQYSDAGLNRRMLAGLYTLFLILCIAVPFRVPTAMHIMGKYGPQFTQHSAATVSDYSHINTLSQISTKEENLWFADGWSDGFNLVKRRLFKRFFA